MFKKFCLMLVMFAVMFLLSENVSAMTFSQPVEIGKIVSPPANGITISGASNNTGKPIGKFQNDDLFSSGIACFGNGNDAIYCHYEPHAKLHWGNQNKDNTLPVESGLYGCSIYQIKNDSKIKFYIVRPIEAMAVVLDYTLLGKNEDGTFVKYFSFRNIWDKYVVNNRPSGRTFTDDIYCNGDSIIIKYKRYGKNGKENIGEFRFKWDDAAQWFGVEHIVY